MFGITSKAFLPLFDTIDVVEMLCVPKNTSAGMHSFISKTGGDAALRKATAEEAVGWYTGITSDMFG